MAICIVQARMGSSRLKGKVLKEILGEPMILISLKRLQKAKYINKLVMATSDLEEDEILYDIVKNAGFEVFRGDEQNVLKRYVDCINQHEEDTVVRVTGDCPFIDPIIVDHVITKYQMSDFDYVRLDVPETFIRGFDIEVFSRAALLRTFGLAKEERYTEHVTSYMYYHPDQFRIGYLKGEALFRKDYRLCVDTMEDFKLVNKVFQHFKDPFVPAREIIRYLDENPELAGINRDIVQKHV
ncbi:MAG: glycosyltransferase family protein [Clostridia bacterium]|nr:glycosyltransferase family protein [Clostridia bacterium]